MKSLRLALDWTPNANHTGFFFGLKHGFFEKENIDLKIISPADDEYKVTPAKKLEHGEADIAIAPMESVISYRTKGNAFPVKAIAALLREDLSAICVREKISRPRDLDEKIYASFEARYEDGIVKELIKNDGGKGELEIIYPPKLQIWNAFLNGRADATWVFKNWEGVDKQNADRKFSYFNLSDYGIPYGYSPVLMASEEAIKNNGETLKRFLAAAKRGFLESKKQPQEAEFILGEHLSKIDRDSIDIPDSQRYTAKYYGDETNWGIMDPQRVEAFLNWMKSKNLEKSSVQAEDLFTNDLLK